VVSTRAPNSGGTSFDTRAKLSLLVGSSVPVSSFGNNTLKQTINASFQILSNCSFAFTLSLKTIAPTTYASEKRLKLIKKNSTWLQREINAQCFITDEPLKVGLLLPFVVTDTNTFTELVPNISFS
jgi:hypothetical protein